MELCSDCNAYTTHHTYRKTLPENNDNKRTTRICVECVASVLRNIEHERIKTRKDERNVRKLNFPTRIGEMKIYTKQILSIIFERYQ